MKKAVLPFFPAVTRDKLIFTSGQVCLTLEGKLLEGTIKEQTHQVMKNLKAVLKKEGVSFKDVVKTTVYVTDMSLAISTKYMVVISGHLTRPGKWSASKPYP